MKRLTTMLLACLMIVTLAAGVSAGEIFTTPTSVYKVGDKTPVIDGVYSADEGWGDPITTVTFDMTQQEGAYLSLCDASHPELLKDKDLIPSKVDVYMRWDEKALYYCAVVVQEKRWNAIPGGEDGNIWKNDSIIFNITSQEDDADKTRAGVGINNDGEIVYSSFATEGGTFGCDNFADWKVTRNEETKTTTYEIPFLWEEIMEDEKVPLEKGLRLRDLLMPTDEEGQENPVDFNLSGIENGKYKYWDITFSEDAAAASADAEEPAEYKAVGEVSVPYATPEIDGVISEGEYPESGKVILNQSNLTALGWVGEVPAENSIELYYAWDKDNFYLAGNVTDPAFEYSEIGQYNMDAFQVSLNIANVFKTDEGYDRAIFYSWGLQEEGTIDVIRQESANNDTIFEVGKGKKTDTGWCFEVPLSLEMLAEDAYLKGGEEAIPEPGMPIGGLFCYLDHDDVGSLINAFGTSTDEVMGWDPDAHGITFMFAEKEGGASTYPASGTEGNAIIGTVIGNETGWGDNAAAGAAAAFDGDVATFFDPLGVGDGFCGIDAGESYILDKVVIMSRADWNARFKGAMIQGSNDGENWTTLWTSEGEGTNPDWYTVTEFENNTGYSQFRYFNTTEHGDVAEVEFYGNPGKIEALPGFETADEAVASIGKTAIAGYTFVEGTGGNGGEGPENLWDGDVATKFCTGEFPISSTAELDDWYTVDGIVMATANDNAEYNGRLPSTWTVSGSADGENWTVIASGDESFFDEVNFRYFAGDASSDAVKFVKFDAEGASSGCFQISELVLTGAKAEAPADEKLDAKAEAPNTFDFGVAAAVAAVISLGGFAVSKKKH